MIHFQNTEYATRTLELSEFGKVLISVASLNDLLLDEQGDYISGEAVSVDEQIFYFVEDGQIKMPYNELRDLLIAEVQ